MFYQLKAVRKNSKPPVWRRIVVPSNITFAQLAVILEEILEYPDSDRYQFEFFTRKERFLELREGERPVTDFQFSLRSAPETFINSVMDEERAFTFSVLECEDRVVPYKITIEQKYMDGSIREKRESGEFVEIQFPAIVKQTETVVQCFEREPYGINAVLREKYFMRKGKVLYLKSADIREEIRSGKGLRICKSAVDGETFIKKSGNRMLNEASELLRDYFERQNGERAERREARGGLVWKYTFSMADSLKAFEKEDLFYMAEAIGLSITAKRTDAIRNQLAKYMTRKETIKEMFLSFNEESLEAFDSATKWGCFLPNQKELELLDCVTNLGYMGLFDDGRMQIPDDVRQTYEILKKEGYREYHAKTSWVLKCADAAICLFRVVPVRTVWKMACQKTSFTLNCNEFVQVLEGIPEQLKSFVLVRDKLIDWELYENGHAALIERSRKSSQFYLPSEQEIEILALEGFPADESAYIEFRNFLVEQLGYQNTEAKLLCRQAFENFSTGGEITDYVGKDNHLDTVCRSREEMEKLAFLLKQIFIQTRRVEWNGFKPMEIQPSPVEKGADDEKMIYPYGRPVKRTEEKIYPNAPCPCGSGKKYKKCCGK